MLVLLFHSTSCSQQGRTRHAEDLPRALACLSSDQRWPCHCYSLHENSAKISSNCLKGEVAQQIPLHRRTHTHLIIGILQYCAEKRFCCNHAASVRSSHSAACV